MFRKLFAPLMVAFCLMCVQDAFAIEQIVFSPSSPKVNEKITFRAVGWDTTGCILWLFGDGDLNEDAIDPYTTTHSYSKAGTYIVKAYYQCDPSATPTTVTVRVGEALGPEAPFSISFIQLRFEDGKAYRTVSKDTPDFLAYADIKYEGTGTLKIQWLVDGKPFTFSSQLLSFARQITLDTGKGLPTQIPGAHDVTIRFIQPAVEFEIPVIRYFVGLTDAGPPANIGLSIKSVTDSEGQSLSILGNTIKAAGRENVILTGEIENKEIRAVPLGRLSIYLGDRLVDQQVIKNLNPGEKRDFDVSLLNPNDTLEVATFVLADEAGRVLQKSTLNLQPLTPPEITPPPVKISSDVVLPPKDLKDIPEPATLPDGVIAQLKVRPRK
ncbi:MAG: PKD domain-containing protein, partial [Deltaproteobacteria bacterium]|nr:PKD domain-containing protein [Deltaproteobacteria bacterium]